MIKWQSSLRKYLPKSGYKLDTVHKSLINLLSISYGLHQHIEDQLQKSGDLLVFDFLTFGYWNRPKVTSFSFFFFLSFFWAKLCQ